MSLDSDKTASDKPGAIHNIIAKSNAHADNASLQSIEIDA